MSEPALSTIKRLFAFSSNRCAFPDCGLPIVENSGPVTGIVCHIKARSKGGPRYDARQTDVERHAFENLVLMCARHSKLIDSDPKTYKVEIIQGMKAKHERLGSIDLSRSDAEKAEALLKDYRAFYISAGGHVMIGSPGAVQGTHVTIKTTRSKVKVMPADGSIGSDVTRRNYIKHLIDRYNEFASKQPGRNGFWFAANYSYIKKKFKADWERISLTKFDDVAKTLRQRIDKTRLGQVNRSKLIPNYSSFEKYRAETTGVH